VNAAGLILAGGESRRMGFPKALLEFGGETFLDRLIRTFAAHCAPVVAVLGAEAERVRAGLRLVDRASIVVNSDYLRGQLSSMQCGLRDVPEHAAGVLFTLVDHPDVRDTTIRKLLGSRAPVAMPRFNGRRGHPIWFSRALVPEFLALSPDSTAKIVLERHSHEIDYVEVDDPGILDNVDDPDAYRRFLREHEAKA
jgi:CTP:molybdopterin cytidylyltransferase MocA